MASLQFVGPAGWAVGAGGVLRSSDGGGRWDVVGVGVRQPRLLDFVDANHGWIVGRDGLWVTQDGGREWRRLPPVAVCSVVESVHFVSPTTGFAVTRTSGTDPVVGRTALRKTSDGGQTWHRLAAPLGAQSVCFQDERVGWLGASYGIYVSRDGGHIWVALKQHPIGTPRPSFVTVECGGDGLAWGLAFGPGGASSQSPHIGYRLTASMATPLFAEQYFPHPGVDLDVASAGSYAGPMSTVAGAAVFVDWCPSCGRGSSPWLVAHEGSDVVDRGSDVGYLTSPSAASFTSESAGCVAGDNYRWETGRTVARIVCTTDGGEQWSIRWEHSAPS